MMCDVLSVAKILFFFVFGQAVGVIGVTLFLMHKKKTREEEEYDPY